MSHKFKGYKQKDKIGVDGSYDVNIWYSYDNDSKTSVINKTVNYNDLFNIKVKQTVDTSSDTDIIVRTLKQPTVSKVNVEGKTISFDIEKELGVEIVGDTKVKISVEEDEEPWDILDDDYTEDINNEIDKEVKEDYL